MLTIGHSIRPLEAFLRLLRAHAVARVVDVRTIPRSRRNPQFNRETLPEVLASAGISYLHIPGLGGLRRPCRDSVNTAWSTPGFRGYADYMGTPEFEANLTKLIEMGDSERTGIMCAEAVPWRCHRSLISDALLARGIQVEHILSETRRQPHRLTPWAKLEGARVTYPLPLVPPQPVGTQSDAT